MTTEEYEQTIRPALAEFCQMGIASIDFDPLNNSADAWALQSTLLEKGAKVELYGFIGKVSCDIFPLSGNMVNARQVTSEAALVMAAWEVVRQRMK